MAGHPAPHGHLKFFEMPATSRSSHAPTGERLLSDEIHYRLLRLLEGCPEHSQRQLAVLLGISVGKVNYCLRALMKKGWVRANATTKARARRAYLYVVTPAGRRRRVQIARGVLAHKLAQVEAIKQEIEGLRSELLQSAAGEFAPARDGEGS